MISAIAVPVNRTDLEELSVLQPVFIGRSILFKIALKSPLTPEQFAACTWNALLSGQTSFQTIHAGYRQFEEDRLKWMELDGSSLNRSWDRALVYLNYKDLWKSNVIMLELEGEISISLYFVSVTFCYNMWISYLNYLVINSTIQQEFLKPFNPYSTGSSSNWDKLVYFSCCYNIALQFQSLNLAI